MKIQTKVLKNILQGVHTLVKLQVPVPYPAIFLGVPLFRQAQQGEKPLCCWGVCGGRCKPSPVGSRGKASEEFGCFAFQIVQNIALMALLFVGLVHETSFVVLFFTLLRVWGSKFDIPNQHTVFKIALDTTLGSLPTTLCKRVPSQLFFKDFAYILSNFPSSNCL